MISWGGDVWSLVTETKYLRVFFLTVSWIYGGRTKARAHGSSVRCPKIKYLQWDYHHVPVQRIAKNVGIP